MFFKKAVKKVCAAILVGTVSLTMSYPIMSMPRADASKLTDILIGTGATAAAIAIQQQKVRSVIKYFNTTSEGQVELLDEFKAKYGVNEDPVLNSRFSKIMADLSNAVAKVDPSINEKPYKYFINNQNSINAACSLGHVMTVNVGTFANIPNDDEIAAIVGHEMGHGQKDHVYKGNVKSMTRQIIAAVGVGALSATTVGALTAPIAGIIALNQFNAHSIKRNEWEADGLSFDYMVNTHYNPGACAAVMQRFIDIMGTQKQSTAAMLLNPSDHPNSEARRDKYVKKLYEYSGKKVTVKELSRTKVNEKEVTRTMLIINGKNFMETAAANGMSAAERSYFVLGNLAAAYHNGQDKLGANVKSGTVYLGNQAIITPAADDEPAQTIADKLNAIR